MRKLSIAVAAAIVAAIAPASQAQADTSAVCSLSGPSTRDADTYRSEGVAECSGTLAGYTISGGRYALEGRCNGDRSGDAKLTLYVEQPLTWDPWDMIVRANLVTAHSLVQGVGHSTGEGVALSGSDARGQCDGGRLTMDLILTTGPAPAPGSEPAESQPASAEPDRAPVAKRKRSCRRAKTKAARRRCARRAARRAR